MERIHYPVASIMKKNKPKKKKPESSTRLLDIKCIKDLKLLENTEEYFWDLNRREFLKPQER